jgi:PKD repeat protein
MAFNSQNFLGRFLIMRNRGVASSEAMRFAAVLSVNDTPQNLSAMDVVITDVVARQQADRAQPAAPPPPPDDGPLTASFRLEFVPPQGEAVLSVQFSDTTEGKVVRRLWDFGDGKTSEAKDPLHHYLKAPETGAFQVKLEVANSNNQDSAVTAIVFPPQPQPG